MDTEPLLDFDSYIGGSSPRHLSANLSGQNDKERTFSNTSSQASSNVATKGNTTISGNQSVIHSQSMSDRLTFINSLYKGMTSEDEKLQYLIENSYILSKD